VGDLSCAHPGPEAGGQSLRTAAVTAGDQREQQAAVQARVGSQTSLYSAVGSRAGLDHPGRAAADAVASATIDSMLPTCCMGQHHTCNSR
jgi:hypothetical protein